MKRHNHPTSSGNEGKKIERCTARERKGRASEVRDESERVAGVLDATQHVHMTGCFTAAHTLRLITSCKNVHNVHKTNILYDKM